MTRKISPSCHQHLPLAYTPPLSLLSALSLLYASDSSPSSSLRHPYPRSLARPPVVPLVVILVGVVIGPATEGERKPYG